MIFLKLSADINPNGRVSSPVPEGHSGHLRLQKFVGSIEYVSGIPQTIGLRKILEAPNDAAIVIAFNNLLKVKYLRRFISKCYLNFAIKITKYCLARKKFYVTGILK